MARDTPESDNDATCVELKTEMFNNNGNVVMSSNGSGSNSNSMNNNSNHRPNSLCSEPEIRWTDIVCVPLMMAYVTRYIYGTDKLRTNAFEVRGLNGTTTGVIHLDDLAILSSWLKYITDNITGLTNLQVTCKCSHSYLFLIQQKFSYFLSTHQKIILLYIFLFLR